MVRPDSYCHTWSYYKGEPHPSKSREVVRKTLEKVKREAIDSGNVFPIQQFFLRVSNMLWRHVSTNADEAQGAQIQSDLNFIAMVWQSEFSEWWEEFAGDTSHLDPITNPPPREGIEPPRLYLVDNPKPFANVEEVF